MSVVVPCAACDVGDHDNHDPEWHGMPGVLGGQQCGCTGDCVERAQAVRDRFAAILPPVTADHTPERLSTGWREALKGAIATGYHDHTAHERVVAIVERLLTNHDRALTALRADHTPERLSADSRSALIRRAEDACRPCGPCDGGLPMGCTCDPEPRAVIAGLLAHLADVEARLAAERAAGVNEGIRLAAQLVKDHALGPIVTPDNVVEFLIRRADRAALHSDPSEATQAGT